jgi:hypothetical protein
VPAVRQVAAMVPKKAVRSQPSRDLRERCMLAKVKILPWIVGPFQGA